MSLQGLGTDMWRAEGRVKFNKKCQLKSARKRIKGVLMDCHDSLQPSLNLARRATHSINIYQIFVCETG